MDNAQKKITIKKSLLKEIKDDVMEIQEILKKVIVIKKQNNIKNPPL